MHECTTTYRESIEHTLNKYDYSFDYLQARGCYVYCLQDVHWDSSMIDTISPSEVEIVLLPLSLLILEVLP